MNGRVNADSTPEGRLAAVARSLMIQMENNFRGTHVGPSEPDYADFREALRPYVQRELLLARIDEARRAFGLILTERMKQLTAEFIAVQQEIPQEFHL
jgi:hypothetical protein